MIPNCCITNMYSGLQKTITAKNAVMMRRKYEQKQTQHYKLDNTNH